MKYLLLIAIPVLSVVSCRKNVSYQSEGQIVSKDLTLCAFCGGDIVSVGDSLYRIDGLPGMSQSQFDQLKLPRKIMFNWEYKNNAPNPGHWIVITTFYMPY